ncbi:MAG: N-acyl homoserine lactonase family protein [Oscillospiraceae bacterium]
MYNLTVLYCGSITADESFHFYGHPIGNLIDSPSYYYLLENNEGKLLVDTGFDSPEIVKEHIGMTCTALMPMPEILRAAGTSPEEIRAVIFTHLHWDHIGNIGAFPNATFYCQREELRWALNPPAWAGGYSRYLAAGLNAVADRFIPIDGDAEPLFGIRVIKVGGHSYGSQAVIVETPNGRVALPGDNIARYRNLEEDIPAGLIADLNDAYAALDKVRVSADIILPSHDWLVLDRYQPIVNAPNSRS